ncbi:NCS2 family permease [Helicobacter sp. MIT 14-3879]|uniref:NCS2 family permease n=1 Tax=Helicobacter sp. MIT 14-3879 TaxID=2040649 RepID=UPI000E1EFDE9|nr:NCS2 family permease [Helicobacter sp. MIT 14-3879]RDU59355.1 guanine permease [Helicobacter sp. MIT 14-3879]
MLERFFCLKARNTTILTEFMAGLTIFLTMAYIIPVGSTILADSGMPKDSLISAICIVTAIVTLVTGLYANMPVAMSVGMGLNVYFSFGLVHEFGLSWQQALGAVFLSACIFLVISVTKFRVWVLQSIPKDLRYALCAGLGGFLAQIALSQIGIISISDRGLLLGNFDKNVCVGITGVFIILLFVAWRLKGAFLLGIFVTALISWLLGIAKAPDKILDMPASIAPIAFQLEIVSILQISMISPLIALLITHLFDSIGTLSGIGANAGLFQSLQGDSRRDKALLKQDSTYLESSLDSKQIRYAEDKPLESTLQVDAAGACFGALCGVSTVTAFLESASGVNIGGRTGLTACFVALFFSLALFFMPFFAAIPSVAIYPVLIIVGAMMFMQIKSIDFSKLEVCYSSFAIVILMPLTSSITNGLCAGFILYVILSIFLGKKENLNMGICIIAFISLIPFISPAL